MGAAPERGGGLDRLPGEASGVPPELPATPARGVVDREHASGEVQRLGGVDSLQAPRDELVAGGGPRLGGAGSSPSEWGTGTLSSDRRTPRANATQINPEGR